MNNWKKQLKRKYEIKYVEKKLGKLLEASDVLWTTRCCPTKLCKKGLPFEMYDSYVTRYFYRFVFDLNLPFGILSDKYGVHLDDEKLSYYDIHPCILSMLDKKKLSMEIRRKAESRGYKRIVFYNNSPLLSKPYFEMLSETGLEIFFTTKLPKKETNNL